VFDREQRDQREEGGDSQTATSREGETMGEAHGDEGQQGSPSPPGPGHPYGGEGVGMPDRGAGRAKLDSTQPIGTEDQGEPEEASAEKKGLRGGGKEK
jgi:hypothetical protein